MLRQFFLAIVVVASLSAAGCGIKGPLVPRPGSAANPVPLTTIPPDTSTAPTARPAERVQ